MLDQCFDLRPNGGVAINLSGGHRTTQIIPRHLP